MDIDDYTRKSIQQQLAALGEAQKAIDTATAPFRAAESKIVEAREMLLEHYDVEIVGECESCDKLLFSGDRGHSCIDGPVLCAEHSPTWGDVYDQWQEKIGAEDDDPEERQAFDRAIAWHLAAGGSRDDKVTHAL